MLWHNNICKILLSSTYDKLLHKMIIQRALLNWPSACSFTYLYFKMNNQKEIIMTFYLGFSSIPWKSNLIFLIYDDDGQNIVGTLVLKLLPVKYLRPASVRIVLLCTLWYVYNTMVIEKLKAFVYVCVCVCIKYIMCNSVARA